MTMIVTTLLAAALATLACPIVAREQMSRQSLLFPPPGGNEDCYGRLTKISMNQTAGYVQYDALVADVPALSAFTLCYWLKVSDQSRGATVLNYALDEQTQLDNLTVAFTPREGGLWVATLNGNVLYSAFARTLERNLWTHFCHAWDARKEGQWSVWENGVLMDHGYNKQSVHWTIPAGGVMAIGQHQNTALSGGMDQGEGVDGEMTLVQVWKSCKLTPSSKSSRHHAKRLANNCVAADRGDLIGWLSTPRRGYGGVTTMVARQRCRDF